LVKVLKPVHHIKPRSQGGSDWEGNIAPVCYNCHTEIHNDPKAAREEGFILSSYDEEKDWRINFPYGLTK
jgi:predicted HNH restriction endonuclease